MGEFGGCTEAFGPSSASAPINSIRVPPQVIQAGTGEVVALAPGWQEWERYEQYKQYGLGPSSNNNIVVKAAPTASRQTHQATAIERYQ